MDNLNEFIDNYLVEMELKYKNDITISNKLIHIKNTVKIAEKIDKDNLLLIIAMKFHDIGRFMQYKLINSFDDELVSHKNLGEQLITKLINNNSILSSYELDQIRFVIQYHGNWFNCPFKNSIGEDTINLVELSGIIDSIENGCLGVTKYLEREILNDEKNLKKRNATLDMKEVSDSIWKNYLNKGFIQKNCKTYADYLIFAASLAISTLNGKYREIAKELLLSNNNQYGNTLDWYKYMFNKYLTPEYSGIAYEILQSNIK